MFLSIFPQIFQQFMVWTYLEVFTNLSNTAMLFPLAWEIPVRFPVEIILIQPEVMYLVAWAQFLRQVDHKPKCCGPPGLTVKILESFPPPFSTHKERVKLVDPRTRKMQSASERSSPEMQKSPLRSGSLWDPQHLSSGPISWPQLSTVQTETM